MEAADTIPTFLVFAFQGCNGPALLADPSWPNSSGMQLVRPVTIPLILMCIAAGSMILAAILWWREVAKIVPMLLLAVAFASIAGFLGYQANDIYQNAPGFASFLSGGNYFIAVGEFSFYLLGVFMMVLVSFILVWREVGWEAERNLLLLGTGSTVLMTIMWVFVCLAVWNCV